MINNKILECLKLNLSGLTITDLERESGLKRCEIRIAIAFLLGAEKITERKIGMAKLYILK